MAVVFSFSFVSVSLAADDYGLSKTANRAGLDKYGDSVPNLVGSVIGTALSLIGVLFFILMVYGGFLWMTDHGKEEQVTKAKDTIIAAVIGMVVVLASYAITTFVFRSINSRPEPNPGGPNELLPAGAACANDEQCQQPNFCIENICGGDPANNV